MTRLFLTIDEYERARAKGIRFVVVPGHEDPTVEIVVERHRAFLIVEKIGEAEAERRASRG